MLNFCSNFYIAYLLSEKYFMQDTKPIELKKESTMPIMFVQLWYMYSHITHVTVTSFWKGKCVYMHVHACILDSAKTVYSVYLYKYFIGLAAMNLNLDNLSFEVKATKLCCPGLSPSPPSWYYFFFLNFKIKFFVCKN